MLPQEPGTRAVAEVPIPNFLKFDSATALPGIQEGILAPGRGRKRPRR